MEIGLFIGRFQPFHLGHLSVIRQALSQVDFLIIGLGSSQCSRTPDNPFTAAERRAMIEGSLADEGIPAGRFRIVEIPDIHDDPKWPAHVRSLAGEFDVVFTGSEHTQKLFEEYENTEIQTIEFELNISATKIRKKIAEKKEWQNDVPQATRDIMLRLI